MARDNRKRTLRILAAQHVRIGMADTRIVDLYPDLVCLWCRHLYIFN